MPNYWYDYYMCLYNYAHFSHILVLSHIFLVTICFSKKDHSLESLSQSLGAQNICKAFFVDVTIMRKI
jgi:hypothetical protein